MVSVLSAPICLFQVWFYNEAGRRWEQEPALLAGHKDWVRDVAWAPNLGINANTVASASQVCLLPRHINFFPSRRLLFKVEGGALWPKPTRFVTSTSMSNTVASASQVRQPTGTGPDSPKRLSNA